MIFKNHKFKKRVSGFLINLTILFFPLSSLLAKADLQTSLLPDDKELIRSYYLGQIRAPEAWETIYQTPEIVVAVIDSGLDVEHPDLMDNLWHNTKEIPNDHLDNDHNGYIDDYQGWDFVFNLPDPRPKIGKTYSKLAINHGTLVAGIIGAMGNNHFGLAGISWQIKIMPLKVMDEQGEGTSTSVYHAIKYAIAQGADVINLSMVGNNYNSELSEVIAEAYNKGIAVVAAAGNETSIGSATDISYDLSVHPQYPICYDGPAGQNHVLGVGAVDADDHKSRFSNFGSKCLDIMAPGESFYGVLFFNPVMPDFQKYFGGYWSGTSLAVPQVSGAVALLKALRPDLSLEEIYNLLIKNADNLDVQNPNYRGLLGGGRLNLAAAISAALDQAGERGSLIIAPASQHSPQVFLINQRGQKRLEFLAYQEAFTGGVAVAAADLDGDGYKDIITAPGKGGGPHLRIFKPSGKVLNQFFAYDQNFTGGVNLAAGDVDGDGLAEIITAPQGLLKSQIKVFSPAGKLKNEFFAYDQNFTGGVNLTLSDIDGNGVKEIVTSPRSGLAPLVKVFDQSGKLLNSFLALDGVFTGGVALVAADLYADRRTEIIVAPQSRFKPQIEIFSPAGNLEFQWTTAEALTAGGVNLAAGNVDKDNQTEIIVASASGAKAQVKIFNYQGKIKNQFNVFEDTFNGGVNLGVK